MKCNDWKIKISVLLDGALPEAETKTVLQHLEFCRDCRAFHEENSAISALFAIRAENKEPSPFIWNKIERRITSASEKHQGHSLLDYFRLPRFAYGLASAALLLSLAAIVQLRGPSTEERRLLAEIETYNIEVQGNPFLERIEQTSRNPFFEYKAGTVNPFAKSLRENK